MIAAMKGHKDIILMLIQKGANLNLVNKVSMYFDINIMVFLCINLSKLNVKSNLFLLGNYPISTIKIYLTF